jgi:lysophospholipase L1-like esterase
LPTLDDLRPEFVTLLIGVNDVVQGVAPATYAANVAAILDALLERLAANRIVTVAIPDYTVTPAGADYGDPRRQHDGIVAANATMTRLAGERGMAFVNIFDLSLRAGADRSLVAADGLHPSGAQYALWVERILPVVEALIGR